MSGRSFYITIVGVFALSAKQTSVMDVGTAQQCTSCPAPKVGTPRRRYGLAEAVSGPEVTLLNEIDNILPLGSVVGLSCLVDSLGLV